MRVRRHKAGGSPNMGTTMHIVVESTIPDSARVQQVRGMFDLLAEKTSRLEWNVCLPIEQKPWHIGLIVGPSGCGKTTVARRLFPEEMAPRAPGAYASGSSSILDSFPSELPIKDVVALLSAVGFASPPAWLRPFDVLSTGQQFRVTLALLLASTPAGQRIVFDEYTSVVDRTVAQIGSAALAKTVRQRKQQFDGPRVPAQGSFHFREVALGCSISWQPLVCCLEELLGSFQVAILL